MRHPQLAVNCLPLVFLSDFSPKNLFLATAVLLARSWEGLKCHNNVQVSVLFTGRQHLDISTWFLAAVKSCCNTANLERAHFYWHEQVWPLLTTQHTGTLLHIMSVGLVHESKQKPVWTLMLVAEERVATPPPPPEQHSGCLRKGALESVPLNTVQVCTYARRKPFTRYKLKATFIAANWEQLSGGNTKKRSKVRHWEARISLIIMYLLVSNVSCTWNVH